MTLRFVRAIAIFSLAAAVNVVFVEEGFAQKPALAHAQRMSDLWHTARAEAESIATANGIPVRVEQTDGRVFELQRFEHGIPRVYTTYNLTSAKTISSNRVWPGGGYGFSLSGLNDTLGEWDAGSPLTTHQEYAGRVLSSEGAVNFHSTHVAGTLIASGVQAQAHGMSYQANLIAHDWNNDVAEMEAAAANGLRVSNHSYGLITGWSYNYFNDNLWAWFGDTTVSGTTDYRFGFYDDEAQAWDDAAYNSPYYLIDKAAGNDRGEGPGAQPVLHWVFNSLGQGVKSDRVRNIDGGATGYKTVNGASGAKNILSVGAVNGIVAGYQQPSDVVMSSFSSWGPTDDGRIKPDIVADGVNLYSSYSTSNTSYATLSGTSMATPSVTGSVGLLLQYQRNLHGSVPLRSSTLRGILLHTADDAGNVGPDYSFGWGLMNTLHAAQLMSLDSAEGPQSHIAELQLLQGDTLSVSAYANGLQPLRVTICWTDPAGTPPPVSLNPTNIMLVNDLDLRVIRQSDLTTYLPWVLDPSNPSAPATTGDNIRDNVEQVLVSTPAAGMYTIRITHKGSLSGGSQYVSLLMSGNTALKPTVAVAPGSASLSVNPGAMTPESLKVRNTGVISLVYALSATQSWLKPDTVHHSILAHDSGYAHFTVDASHLSQWSSFNDTILVSSNDPANPLLKIPVSLSTQGPKIQSIHSPLALDTDSGIVAQFLLTIRNIGTTPLSFLVSDNDSVPRPWLALSSDSGVIAIGDSHKVHITVDADTLRTGIYNASLRIVTNDSSTGTVLLPVVLTILNGVTIQSDLDNRWNIVSLPVTPLSMLKSVLYPTAASFAFTFAGSYQAKDTLAEGPGYWLKFNGAQSVAINGYQIVSESIHVSTGWNLTGSITSPVPVSTISASVAGMVTSNFIGYAGKYLPSDTIKPGKGYWVKVNQDGFLILSSSASSEMTNRIKIVPGHDDPPPPPAESNPRQGIPSQFTLEQAYPNPFNPTTTIEYELPVDGTVRLTVYNVLGQSVANLVDRQENAGYKSAVWNAVGMGSGVYYYRLDVVGTSDPSISFTKIGKMILMK